MAILMTEQAREVAAAAFTKSKGKRKLTQYRFDIDLLEEVETIEEVRELVYAVADGIDYLLKTPCIEAETRLSLVATRDAGYDYLDAAQRALGLRRN